MGIESMGDMGSFQPQIDENEKLKKAALLQKMEGMNKETEIEIQDVEKSASGIFQEAIEKKDAEEVEKRTVQEKAGEAVLEHMEKGKLNMEEIEVEAPEDMFGNKLN